MKKNKKIPVFDIALGEIEKKYINDCLDTSFIGQGPYVKKLEEKFSSFVDCKYGVTTTSGTTALHLACALEAMEVNASAAPVRQHSLIFSGRILFDISRSNRNKVSSFRNT